MIPRASIDAYTNRINGLSAATKRVITQAIEGIEFDSVSDLRERLIEVLEPILGASTDIAAAYAADFYDYVRSEEVGKRLGAIAESNRNPKATEGFVRAFVDKVFSNGLDHNRQLFSDRADYEIKRAAGECMYANGERDPLNVRFARVPSGIETCDFCIMLASRGFVYRSKQSAGGDGHYHPNCDCRIVPGFDGTDIEGYDPDALYRQWRDSEFKPKPKSRKHEND